MANEKLFYVGIKGLIEDKTGKILLLKADVTANSDDDKALLKRFQLFGPPGTIFFDPQGREVGEGRRGNELWVDAAVAVWRDPAVDTVAIDVARVVFADARGACAGIQGPRRSRAADACHR